MSTTDYSAPHILDSWVPLEDVMSRAFAAAAKVLTGDSWGYSRKVDCAADIIARVMELAPRDGCYRCGGPVHYRATLRPRITGILTGRAVARNVRFCTAHAPRDERRPYTRPDGVQRRYVSFYRLVGMAKNWRESELARSAREDRAAAEHVSITEESSPMADGHIGTPYGAGMRASGILADLGVESGGILYNVAYAAAREADGLTADEIAAELDVKPGTLRQHVNRAASKVPSAKVYTPRAHAEALHVDAYWTLPRSKDATALPSNFDASNLTADESTGKIERTGKGGRRVTGTARHIAARVNGGTRILPGDRTPNITGPHAEVPDAPLITRTGEPTAAPWDGHTCATWAESLYPSTAARLAAAAREQRSRAAQLADLDRSGQLAAVGIGR